MKNTILRQYECCRMKIILKTQKLGQSWHGIWLSWKYVESSITDLNISCMILKA